MYLNTGGDIGDMQNGIEIIYRNQENLDFRVEKLQKVCEKILTRVKQNETQP